MKLKNRVKKNVAMLMTGIMLATCAWTGNVHAQARGCSGLAEKDVYYPEKEDVVPDPILNWAIRSAMSKNDQKLVLTKEDVASSTVQYIFYESSSNPNGFKNWKMPWYVESLEGLQYATSAKQIVIGFTAYKEGARIKDLTPLSGLSQLEQLFLKGDGITDISALKSLTNLRSLLLNENEITDISAIANMKKLTRLSLIRNKVSDIAPLGQLPELRTLDVSYNKLKKLPDMSGLTSLTSLDVSDNPELTDIASVSKIKSLERISLTGDLKITDIRPLAELTSLDKEMTYLPDNSKKDDLFAAIEVNKCIDEFSISNMSAADLKIVQKALDTYDKLTEEQKTYIDEKKIQAIKSNKEKIEKGEAPDAYPEYENESNAIWDRIEIRVVDKKGVPMEGVKFVKEKTTPYVKDTEELVSDENGMLIVPHKMMDTIYDKIAIRPADEYIANPEEIYYTVSYGVEGGPPRTTATVNGVKATGKEKLKFVLSKAGEEESKPEPTPEPKPEPTPEVKKVKSVTLSKTSYVYDGKTHKPSIVAKNDKGEKITSKDYTVKYAAGCKNVGSYTVKVTFKGDYKGTFTKTFKINPKGTSLSKVKAARKSFSATWKKQSKQTSGYQLQYSTNKKFAKSVKTSTISKNTTVKKTVKKLSAKKTYYVRVRTYKNVKAGKKTVKLYSGWSKVKAVKTK